jgi:hypothetical protein
LEELLRTARREERAERERYEAFSVRDLFLSLRSRDRMSKKRVRKALPDRDDGQLLELITRLLERAATAYLSFRSRWEREVLGYLTSIGAEVSAALGLGPFRVPDGLDYVGLEAEGVGSLRPAILARHVGAFAGMKAVNLDLEASTLGDYGFRRAVGCRVVAGSVGKCFGEEAEDLHLRAERAGDWLFLKSSGCLAEVGEVGRLAGLDSRDLRLFARRAGAELGARAEGAELHVTESLKGLGLRGRGTVYLPPHLYRMALENRTSFRLVELEETPGAAGTPGSH